MASAFGNAIKNVINKTTNSGTTSSTQPKVNTVVNNNPIQYSSGNYGDKIEEYQAPVRNRNPNDKVYGTVDGGKDWQTGVQVVDDSYRNGNTNDDNRSVVNNEWQDPNESSHVVVRLPSGVVTSLDRETAIANSKTKGWEIISSSNFGGKYGVEQGARDNDAGSEWVDSGDGYNNGSIMMTNNDGRMSSVNATFANKYFDQGYTLDPRSQSVNRALQANVHQQYLAANGAIKDGTYNPNADYSGGFSHTGMDMYDQSKNLIYQPQGVTQAPPSVVGNQTTNSTTSEQTSIGGVPIGSKTDSGAWVIKYNGQDIEMNESDYTEYMLKSLGIDAVESNPYKEKKTDAIAIDTVKTHIETPEAETKAIQAKLKAEQGTPVKVPTSKINSFIDSAKTMIGYTYSQSDRMGKKSADCSSLVGRAMKLSGITNDAFVTTRSMVTDPRFEKISKVDAKPGDIMWQTGHVGIKLENGKVLEASSSKNQVREANLGNRFTHAYRIKGIN